MKNVRGSLIKTMNKKQLEFKRNILASFHRRRNEQIAEMQNRINQTDKIIMQIERGNYKLWNKNTNKEARKSLLKMGVVFLEIEDVGFDIASWEVDKNGKKA